jgi:hypothetical protein
MRLTGAQRMMSLLGHRIFAHDCRLCSSFIGLYANTIYMVLM